jgi:hypothetical protein
MSGRGGPPGAQLRRGCRRSRLAGDLAWAWAAATLFSGLPSTLHALATGGDVTEATRAAGAMLIPADSSLPRLLAAAALVHAAVSLFWSAILVLALPRRGVVAWALVASALIGVLDLRVIAPVLFPEVARLSFAPQLADHLAWGLCVGLALRWRDRHARR